VDSRALARGGPTRVTWRGRFEGNLSFMESGCRLVGRASCYTRAVVRMRAERAYGRKNGAGTRIRCATCVPRCARVPSPGLQRQPPRPRRERGMVRERERARLLKDEWSRATIRAMMPPIRDRAGKMASRLRYDRERERERERGRAQIVSV